MPNNLLCSIPVINLTHQDKPASHQLNINVDAQVSIDRVKRILLAAALHTNVIPAHTEPTIYVSGNTDTPLT